MNRRPVLLIIFDGFGLNSNRLRNGWALARTPHFDEYFASNPHTALQASGLAVGLPDGQFGNSEVGHLTLGAGRILEQQLLRITGEPHTLHTVYPVPFLLLGERGARLGIGRGLSDVAPTVLDSLKTPQSLQMTGRSLILKGVLESK